MDSNNILFPAIILCIFYLLFSVIKKLKNNLSFIKPTKIMMNHGGGNFYHRYRRYFKCLAYPPKFVLTVLGLLLFFILLKYWNLTFSSEPLPPHYFKPINTFWGHLRESEKVKEIVCSRFSKDCYAIVDDERNEDSIIRYLYSEKLGTGGYLTRMLVLKINHELIIDKENVVSSYVKGMLLGGFLTNSIGNENNKKESILIVGLGGGAMNNFFSTLENQPNVTIVEIDQTVIYIAEKWFGSKPSSSQNFIIDDAITFIQKRTISNDNERYDAILVDCSATVPFNDYIAPIRQFFDPEVIKDIKRNLKPNGTMIANVVTLNFDLGEKILVTPYELYSKFFNTCFYLKASLNYILVCTDQIIKINSYPAYDILVQRLSKHINSKLTREIKFQPYYGSDQHGTQ